MIVTFNIEDVAAAESVAELLDVIGNPDGAAAVRWSQPTPVEVLAELEETRGALAAAEHDLTWLRGLLCKRCKAKDEGRGMTPDALTVLAVAIGGALLLTAVVAVIARWRLKARERRAGVALFKAVRAERDYRDECGHRGTGTYAGGVCGRPAGHGQRGGHFYFYDGKAAR